MSLQGHLTLSTYGVRLMLNSASVWRHINTSSDVRTGRQVDVCNWLYVVVTNIQLKSDVKMTSGACWEPIPSQKLGKKKFSTTLKDFCLSDYLTTVLKAHDVFLGIRTKSTYGVRLMLNSASVWRHINTVVVTNIQLKSDVKMTAGACWEPIPSQKLGKKKIPTTLKD